MYKRRTHRSPKRSSLPLATWNNRLYDVPCFLIGNGPSLNNIDTNRIVNFFSIGINRAFYKIDTTVLMWQDISLYYSERIKMQKTSSLKLCTQKADPDARYSHFEVEGSEFKIPQHANILHGSGTSVPLAVQLAIVLGCNPIILCGCDCKVKNNKTNFYGNNKYHNNNTMRQCSAGLRWIKEEIHDKKIKNIISCSENDFFQNASLNEVLQSINKSHQRDFSYYADILK